MYHVDNKFGPFSITSMIQKWASELSSSNNDKNHKERDEMGGFLERISDDISHQLHSVIMKSSRRIIIDDIISSIIPDFVTSRKMQINMVPQPPTKDVQILPLVEVQIKYT